MHTVDLLEKAIALAAQNGFVVRQDWFGGVASGACEFKGRRWIFIDLALTPVEQLDQVIGALRGVARLNASEVDPALCQLLDLRRSA